MISKNAATQQPSKPANRFEIDCQNCQMRVMGGTDIVECLMKSMDCPWAMAYGFSRILCKNPSAKQFVIENVALDYRFA